MKATTKWYLKGIAYVILIAIVIGLMTMLSSCQPKEELGSAGLPINTERHSVEEIMQMALNNQPIDEDIDEIVSVYYLNDILSVANSKTYLEEKLGNWVTIGPIEDWYYADLTGDGVTYTNTNTGDQYTIFLDFTVQEIVEDYGANAYTGYLFQDYEDPSVFYIIGGWINGNSIFDDDDDYYMEEDPYTEYPSTNNGMDDRPPDIDSIWEVTSDPIPVSDIDDNEQRFIRDYNGQYITIYGEVSYISEDHFGLYSFSNVIIYPRYQEVIYDLNVDETVGIYGKLDYGENGTLDIIDAQVFISDFADF